jgi:uncharacterized protein (TIGR00304 family)
LTITGIFVSVIGATLIIVGLFLSSLQAQNVGSISFGGAIVIGPIPIVFGTDRVAVLIAVVGAVILMATALAITLINSRRRGIP